MQKGGWNSRDISYRFILDHPRKRWRIGDDAWPSPSVSVDVGKGETGAGLCNVCDYVGNYSHPWAPDRPLASFHSPPPPHSPRRSRLRKGCNSLLARNRDDREGQVVITAPK